jgi:AraC-like DNA-binding protein
MRESSNRKRAAERSAIWRVPALGGVEAFKAHLARFSYARHSHESYALGVIDVGAMQFWHRGTVRAAPVGTIIAINPGEVHDGHAATTEGCQYRMLYVERATIERLLEIDVPKIRRIFALCGPTIEDPPLERAFRRLHWELDRSAMDSSHLIGQQSYLTHVLHLFFARHGEQSVPSARNANEARCVLRAKAYIAENVASAIRLDEIAEYVGLSPFYFLRTFKRATGLPPHSYLNLVRVERARALLRAGEPPAAVAATFGFVDQSHFSRRFKAAFGVTPGQYAGTTKRHPRVLVPVERRLRQSSPKLPDAISKE